MEQHVIKVRYKSPALAFVFALLLCLPAKSQGAGCDKTPRDQYAAKTDGNNGFAIQINGSPRLYRPNQIYTITLKVNGKVVSKYFPVNYFMIKIRNL